MSEMNMYPSVKIIRREAASAWNDSIIARTKADEILDQARAEAEALIAQAQDFIEEETSRRVTQQMAEITSEYNYNVAQIEDNIVDLVQQCLLQIVNELPSIEFLQGLIQRAVNELDRLEDSIHIIVSPWQLLEAEAALSQCQFHEDVNVRCVADDTLDNDTILVANKFGVVDISPIKQIDALYAAMREGLGA